MCFTEQTLPYKFVLFARQTQLRFFFISLYFKTEAAVCPGKQSSNFKAELLKFNFRIITVISVGLSLIWKQIINQAH